MKKIFYYLNYKNLFKEIKQYGFVYSWKKLLVSYAITIAAAICIGILFELELPEITVILVCAVLALPLLIRNAYNSLYQQKRFSDVNQYVEKMLYSFKADNFQILNALRDVQSLFPTGPMHEAIEKGLANVENAYEGDLKEAALNLIEQEYPCERIRKLHKFMLSVSRNGGECEASIDMLLKDRQLWSERVLAMQKEKKRIKNNILFSVILSSILCLMVLYMPNMIQNEVWTIDIAQYGFVKWSAVIFILLQLMIYVMADKKLCIDWLDEADRMSEQDAEKMYYRVINYDGKTEFLYSVVWAVLPAVLCAIAFVITRSAYVFIPGLAGIIFMLNQHKIGHALSKKKLVREIEKAYPTWLMDVSLLLQTESVRPAIKESYEYAPYILRPALREFIDALEKDPVSVRPYDTMLGQLELPDVRDSMGTLYSISTGAGGDVTAQFAQIIERTISLTDRAEKLKNEDKLAVYNGYIALPSIVGGFKLLIDMSALLIAFFSISF